MTDHEPSSTEIRDLVSRLLVEGSVDPAELSEEGSVEAQTLRGLRKLEQELTGMREASAHADRRLTELRQALTALVSLNYAYRAPITPRGDAFDGFALGLNLMAEELAARTVSKDYVDNILQSMNDLLLVVDGDGTIKTANRAACALLELSKAELIGRSIRQVFPALVLDDIIERSSDTLEELELRTSRDRSVTVSFSAAVMRDKLARLLGVVCVARDLTERKRLETERWQLQEAVQRQEIILEELAAPIIPISPYIVVIPLVGTVSGARAKRITPAFVHGVASMQAKMVILDVTGVRTIDEHALPELMNAVQALRLLGAQVILTGIRPDLAMMLVDLDVNLQGVPTCISLQNGILEATRRLRASSTR